MGGRSMNAFDWLPPEPFLQTGPEGSLDRLTLVRTNNPCGKRFWIGADGKIGKASAGDEIEGEAITVHVPDAEAMATLLRLLPTNFYVIPDFIAAAGREPFEIMAQQRINNALGLLGDNRPSGMHKLAGHDLPVWAKLKENFTLGSWRLFDFDRDEHAPADIQELSTHEAIGRLEAALPGLAGCSRVVALSSSGRVLQDGKPAKPSPNFHIWVQTADPDLTDQFRQRLLPRLAAAGLGWKKPRGDKMGPAALIDPSVWAISRCVYAGAPGVGEGLSLAQADLLATDGHRFTLASLPDTTDAERAAMKSVFGIEFLGGGGASFRDTTGQLTTDTVLVVKGHKPMTLAEFMANDAFKPGRKYRCQTPFRASTSWNGILRKYEGGRASIFDNGTGVFYEWPDPLADFDVEGEDKQATADGKAEWADPKPIHAELHPVPCFDPEVLLPEPLRRWVMDEADRMPCPPEYVAVAALVAIGAIVGARCAMKPKALDSWLVVPNLWGGIVGQPSAKKSPAIEAALKPLNRLVALAMETHQAELETFESEKLVFEAKKEGIEARIKAAAKDPKKGDVSTIVGELQAFKEQAPKAPTLRRYKSNDTTVEKLGELLRENPSGLLVLRDELVGLVASWEREGREGERAFYLEAWNGNSSFDTDRIGRGSIFIPNLCVSIFGGIQPDKLTGYLEQAADALANDGMLQRFQLLAYPDPRPWEWRDRSPEKEARDRAFSVFDALADFDPQEWGAAPADDFAKFPFFRFDEAAQEIFIEWSGDLHRLKLPAEDQPIIAQHLAKYDKLFPALALILHLVECAASGRRGPVTMESALRAAAWCDFLEAHARRCYGLLLDEGFRSAKALADKVRHGCLTDGFTARDVRRNQWSSLKKGEAVEAALEWLEDEGWLRSEQTGGDGPGTGRRTRRYFINPKVVKSKKG